MLTHRYDNIAADLDDDSDTNSRPGSLDQSKSSILLNPFPKKDFSARERISETQKNDYSDLPQTEYSSKSYSPRDQEEEWGEDNKETMSYDVYRVHRGKVLDLIWFLMILNYGILLEGSSFSSPFQQCC